MSAVMSMEDAFDEERKPWGTWAAIAVAAVVVIALVAWGVSSMSLGGNAGPKRQTVKIAVLPDTPPPPPPPKPEKLPEPEKQELKPQMQQEQVKPQEAPPEPQQLKMDGPAGDGPSAFAAGQVTSEYKGGDVGTGTGGVNRMQFALFTSQLQRHIQSQLARNQKVKQSDYSVNVKVWISPSGDFQRVELLTDTGDGQLDEAIRSALDQMSSIRDVPGNLPQPIKLRITNRMTG